jgi:hypothetical protein
MITDNKYRNNTSGDENILAPYQRGHGSSLGYPYGGQMTYVSASQVSIGKAGETSLVRSSANDFDIEWTGVLTGDITVSGAGGLDTGSEAADTSYAVHVITDKTAVNTPAVLFSLSGTAPTIPSGYDTWRRLGWFRNNSSSDIIPFTQRGKGVSRRIRYDEDKDNVQVLGGVNATTFTPVDLSAFVPPTAGEVLLRVGFAQGVIGVASDIVQFRHTGSTETDPVFGSGSGTKSAIHNTDMVEVPIAGQSVDYKVSSANNSLNVSVAGYTDEL